MRRIPIYTLFPLSDDDFINKVAEYVVEIEADTAGYIDILKLDGGVLIGEANMNHCTWLAYYGDRQSVLRSLYGLCEDRLSFIRAKLYQYYTESYPLKLSSTQVDKYISSVDEYQTMTNTSNLIKDVLTQYDTIMGVLVQRGYCIKNKIQLLHDQMSDATI
jgi:hypothetical protein